MVVKMLKAMKPSLSGSISETEGRSHIPDALDQRQKRYDIQRAGKRDGAGIGNS